MRHGGGSGSAPGWRNRPVVLEADEDQTRSLGRSVAILSLALLPVLVYIIEIAQSRQVAYQLTAAQLDYEELTKVERELAAERARLESLRGIETWAMEEHGLCRPAPEEVEVVRSDGPREAAFFARGFPGARGATRD